MKHQLRVKSTASKLSDHYLIGQWSNDHCLISSAIIYPLVTSSTGGDHIKSHYCNSVFQVFPSPKPAPQD